MKVFQILNGLCHWDATRKHPDLESTIGKYASNIVFVEAPDYVFEGWGFDETQIGDDRFIQPEAPEGWAYDAETGTFYPINENLISTLSSGPTEYDDFSKDELIMLCEQQRQQIQALLEKKEK